MYLCTAKFLAMICKNKNREEDLKLLVDLGEGYSPGVEFQIEFFSGKLGRPVYVCAGDGNSEYTNCLKVDGRHVLCLLDNHGLALGRIDYKITLRVPDDQMPDGNMRVVTNGVAKFIDQETGEEYCICLTNGASDSMPASAIHVTLLDNLIKGDAATIDEVTIVSLEPDEDPLVQNLGDEHHARLHFAIPRGKNGYTPQKGVDYFDGKDADIAAAESATAAANAAAASASAAANAALEAKQKAEQAMRDASAAADHANGAANAANSASLEAAVVNMAIREEESKRQEAENARQLAEEARALAADALKTLADSVDAAEKDRAAAEVARAEAEANRKKEETARKSAETQRKNKEAERETAEAARKAEEEARQLAEAGRQEQFQTKQNERDAEFQSKEAQRDAAVAEATKVAQDVTDLTLKLGEDADELKSAADKAVEDAAKAIEDVEQIDAEIVEHYLVVTDRNGDKHKIDLYEALKSVTIPLINTDVEGYMRVSGVSDPSLSYRQFPKSEFGRSVFSIFYPCLIGNNFTGRVGEILHILDKLNYERDIEGNVRKIDGSEGEVLITNIKSYWAIHGRYKIDGVEYDIFMESLNPFTFHGIEAIEVKPFGWSPDYCVSHKDADNVTRMHSVYNPAWAGSYSAPIGIVGRYNYSTDDNGNIVEQFDSAGLINGNANGNHTTDIALYTGEQYAMNINTDKTTTVPFMNQTARGAELLWANMLAETGTFDAHKEMLMGSGYCADYSANGASYWAESYAGARNGIRYVAADGTTKYTTFGYFTALQKQVFGLNINCMAQMINQYRSPWKCMERHRVIAYAIENKIAELTWFAFEGNMYKWRSVPGIAGPEQGEMTCVLWKIMSSQLASGTIDPTDGATSVAGNRIDYLVSTALYHGMVTDVSPSWWTSGLIFSQYGDGTYKAYMQRDQSKLIISENATKNEDESFNFETRYKQVGDVYDKAEGYRKNYCNDAFMLPDTNVNLKGGALHTYVGGYNWFTGTAPAVGKKASRGFRRGNSAVNAALSPLTMNAGYAPSGAGPYYAFGICCEIEISGS